MNSSLAKRRPSPGGRLKQFRKLMQMNQKELSGILDISQGTLSQIENSYYAVSIKTLTTLHQNFQLNTNWLVSGQGEIFVSKAMPSLHPVDWPAIPIIYESDSLAYPAKYADFEFLKSLERVQVPGIRDRESYRIFQMVGDSMVPSFSHGDFLITRRLNPNLLSLKRRLAIIVTPNKVLCKRISKASNGKTDQLLLENDHNIYRSESLAMSKVKEFWLVVSRFTSALEMPLQFNFDRFQQLEAAIEELKKEKDF